MIAVLSISASPPSSTSVGTRRSGLYGAILSPSPKVDHGRCSNGSPYSRIAIATRRTKGESYWPIRNMGGGDLYSSWSGKSAKRVFALDDPAIHVFVSMQNK
jgi:hypothetical protein